MRGPLLFLKALLIGVSMVISTAAPTLAPGNWVLQASPTTTNLRGVYFVDALVGYAVGDNGSIIKTVDGGANWVLQPSPTTKHLLGVYFVDSLVGYVVGEGGDLIKTVDGGANWVLQASPTTNHLRGVHFVDSLVGYVVADGGDITKTVDGGANWVLQGSPTTKNLRGVYLVDALVGYVVGDNGSIIKTVDGGANWVLQTSPTAEHLSGVYFVDSLVGYAVGDNGDIIKTVDGGANWVLQTSPTTKHLSGVHFVDSLVGYAVGQGGAILRTGDGGDNWLVETPPVVENYGAVHFPPGSAIGWVVGEKGTIIHRPGGSPPALDPIGDRTVDEPATLGFTTTATDPDLPAETLTFSLEGSPPSGAWVTAGGVFSWTPTEAQGPNSYSVTVRVTDAAGLWDEETFTLTVAEVNTAPTPDPIADGTIPELSPYGFSATAADPDVPADTLTWSLVSGPPGAAIGSGGAFSWTPGEDQGPGSYLIRVRVSDGGVPNLWDDATFTVTVAESNTSPAIDFIADQSVTEGSTLSFSATATDADLPANTLSFSLQGIVPPGAAIGSGGAFSWTPGEDQGPGSYLIRVRVSDGLSSDEVSCTITVDEVNVAVVADAIADVTIPEMSPYGFSATATDPDSPANTLTWSLVSGPTGAAISSGGAFSWTPTETQGPGSHLVILGVSDGPSGDQVSFTITVKEVNVEVDLPPTTPAPEAPLPPPPAQPEPTAEPNLPRKVAPPPAAAPALPSAAAVAASARKENVVATLSDYGVTEAQPDEASVIRTLVIMGGVTAVAVRSLGVPFVFLVLLSLMVIIFGNITIFPLIGRSRRLQGAVVRFDQASGYGFIVADESDSLVFVHGQTLRRRARLLLPGQRVSFRMIKASHRDFALAVRRIEP